MCLHIPVKREKHYKQSDPFKSGKGKVWKQLCGWQVKYKKNVLRPHSESAMTILP